MCLVTNNKDGFIATTDIVVYKKLERISSTMGWRTPNMGWEVKFDSELIPDEEKPDIHENSGGGYHIYGGVIHSCLKTVEGDGDFFKAIIKKGTKFWIRNNLSEICSERLYLTSEKVTDKVKTDLSFLYQKECLDLLTKEGKRIPWSEDVQLEDVKGIFVYESQAVGLEITKTSFSRSESLLLPNRMEDWENAKKDISGRKRTEILKKLYPRIEILQNLPEGSYIPSCGELLKVSQNLISLNLTRQSLGLKVIDPGGFWSSTPYSEYFGWYCYPNFSFFSILTWKDSKMMIYIKKLLPFLE